MSTNINIKKRITILEESAILTKDVNSIDFIGAGVIASIIGEDVTVTIPGGSGNTTYYLNESVTQAPYKEFSSIVTSAIEQVVPLTVAGGVTSVIAEYQTPSGVPGTTQIPGGLWQFFLHFNAGSAGQNWIIRPTVLKRDLGGIETLLFTPDPEIVTSMNVTTEMYTSDGVFPATTLLTTDRIVVRISMQNTTGVSQTVNFRTEGSQHYSVGLTTLNQVIPTGAVTSVTGTAPVVSSGGTTPAISIPQATGAVDGYLSSSDFAVFNAKVGGSGTLNYVSKFTGTGTIGNSNIFDDGTNVGIGITTPTASLHVTNVGTQDSFLVEDSTNPDTTPFVITNTGRVGIGTTTPGYELDIRSSNPQLRVYADINNRAFSIYPGQGTIESDNTAFYINRISTNDIALGIGGGNVGIGTATPTVPLQVKGTAIPSAGEAIARFEVSDSSSFLQIVNAASTNGVFAPIVQGRQIGSSSLQAIAIEGIIDVVDDTGTVPVTLFQSRLVTLNQVVTRPVYQFRNWTTNIMTMLANGNVGIGTITPTELLDVNGDALVNGLTVGRGGGNIATNTVVGVGTGNTISTGSSNTFIGYNTGLLTTTGIDNTFIGKSSGVSNTTGGANTSNGKDSLFSNTTGPSNVANGTASLYSNTTGGGNVAIGVESLFSSTGGYFNVANGYRAGRYLADGTTELTASGDSVFLGANTKSSLNNQTNQIVIGYNAIGKNSNTVQLGNTSITDTYLQGAVTFNNAYKLPIVAPTSGQVLGYLGAGTTQWTTVGSLTYFTEAQNTTAPNATVPVDSLTAVSATTNADIAIVPKASGALLAAIPDGTATGGNKRGINALDLQMSRSSQVMVASGNFSAILCGSNNMASGANSVVAGSGNSANGSLSFAIGHNNNSTNNNSYCFGNENLSNGVGSYSIGRFNNASGSSAVAIGGSIGTYNTASGTRSVAIGEANTASGTNAIALGQSNISNGSYSFSFGRQAHTFGIDGRQAYASGQEGTSGDAQVSKFILHERTTGNTATTITTNSSAAATNNQVILSDQSAYRFKGSIVGKQSGSVNAAVWDIDGFIVRGANAAATTLNISNVNVIQNTPGWGTPTLAADTTNGGLRVQVTGATATNIQWTAVIDTTEVIYA